MCVCGGGAEKLGGGDTEEMVNYGVLKHSTVSSVFFVQKVCVEGVCGEGG